MGINFKKDFTWKQKILLHFYKLELYLVFKWYVVKVKIERFVDSFYFYLPFFAFFIFFIHKVLISFNHNIPRDTLFNFAFATAGIIGASIAIIFSFSTFILQSTADLFSTGYLKKFIKDPKETLFFWLLSLLTIISFFTPIFFERYVLETLSIFLFIAFYLIYSLYKRLRKRIDPETTLEKIKDDTIKRLEKVNKIFKKQAHIQNKIFHYDKESNYSSLDVQYKLNRNWHFIILENVKCLYEIGLKLLAKNEVNSFNLTLEYICDIYLKHLDLRNSYFIIVQASIWGNFTVDDEGFTNTILEYLKSLTDEVIQENRKESIFTLSRIYKKILNYSLDIKYADKDLEPYKCNPLLNLVLTYYIGFVEKLLKSKENDLIWESVKSISSVSNTILQKTANYFVYSQINQTIKKIASSCLTKDNEVFLKEIVNIYFNQIEIGWNRYAHNVIFWEDLFKELKINVLLLSLTSSPSLSVSDLFMNFNTWQVILINLILSLKDKKEQKEKLIKFIKLLERWSVFLLDFARDLGLENKRFGLPIIHSIDNNLRIIYEVKSKFKEVDLEKIYKTQFYSLSWYFQKTNKVDNCFLMNLEELLKILLREIRYNLKAKIFEINQLVELYVSLIEQHFERVTFGFGYNHPRIIKKLVYLGLILHKYKKFEEEKKLIAKIEELNKKYLEFIKKFIDLKGKKEILIGPSRFQLCKEIHDLENDLFSYNNFHLMDMENILKQEITKDDWQGFVNKINLCNGIECKSRSRF